MTQMRAHNESLKGAAAEAAQAAETQRPGRADGSHQNRSAGFAGGDRVELSSALESLSRALGADRAQRSGQVQALAEQYQSGQYRADAAAASRGLVAEALARGRN